MSFASRIKSTVQHALRGTGYELRKFQRGTGGAYAPIEPYATYSPWLVDQHFLDAYRLASANTLVDRLRCFEIWQLVMQTSKLEGSLLEVGVWRGGTGSLIARSARLSGIEDPVYLCDTFTGVVKAGTEDSRYRGGEHSDTSEATVRTLLDAMRLQNVILLKGIFPEATASPIANQKFRFCHIDVDVYQSAEDILNWVWSRLCVGGIVVYDDYGFEGCDGITKHVDAQRVLPGRAVVHNLNGHAIIVKTG